MAGKRSRKLEDLLLMASAGAEAVEEAPVDEAPSFAASADADALIAQARARADRLAAELAAAHEALASAKGAEAESPAVGWDDVVIIPRVIPANYNGNLVVNGHAARAVMVLDGTLLVRGPGNSVASRVLAGGYLLLAKGQPYALSAEAERVRAVFVETPDYAKTLTQYQEHVAHAAVPSAVRSSWQDVGATAVHSPVTLSQDFPQAPMAVDTPSKAVQQLAAIQAHRGQKSHRVRHPNEPTRMPVPAPQTAAQAANVGKHPSGAPLPVQDARALASTGDVVVQ